MNNQVMYVEGEELDYIIQQNQTILNQNEQIINGLASVDNTLGIICALMIIIIGWSLASRIIGAFFKS